MLLDIAAPIIPFKGFGEIKLYSTRDELSDLLSLNNVEAMVINENWIRYDIQNSIELFFHLGNNKLFRITTLDNYKGRLFEKIGVGTTEQEMLEFEPSFVYNEFEEVWESDKVVLIEISDQKMYQVGEHFNKHGWEMGYLGKKEYEQAARNFLSRTNPRVKYMREYLIIHVAIRVVKFSIF